MQIMQNKTLRAALGLPIYTLTLNACSMSMSKLEWFLQELSTLKQFRLITAPSYDDESILDGHRWEKLLSNME